MPSSDSLTALTAVSCHNYYAVELQIEVQISFNAKAMKLDSLKCVTKNLRLIERSEDNNGSRLSCRSNKGPKINDRINLMPSRIPKNSWKTLFSRKWYFICSRPHASLQRPYSKPSIARYFQFSTGFQSVEEASLITVQDGFKRPVCHPETVQPNGVLSTSPIKLPRDTIWNNE